MSRQQWHRCNFHTTEYSTVLEMGQIEKIDSTANINRRVLEIRGPRPNIRIPDRQMTNIDWNFSGVPAPNSIGLQNSIEAPILAPNSTPIKQLPVEVKPVVSEAGKYILDNHQVTAAGMRKLARNWELCLSRIDRSSDGQLTLRRSSDSSETSGNSVEDKPSSQPVLPKLEMRVRSNSSSSGGSRSTDSLESRVPWKPC